MNKLDDSRKYRKECRLKVSNEEKKENKQKNKKKSKAGLIIAGAVIAVIAVVVFIFCSFGGFGTGDCADVEEFAKYAAGVDSITIPSGARIVALGEATHGTRECHELKLTVFREMVEREGVRAFVIEGDFGGSEHVNRYIHGGEGSATEAAEAIGFAIYCTDEMAELIQWMRDYNDSAPEEDKLSFYGNDMQRYEYNYRYLIENAKMLGIDTGELEKLIEGEELTEEYTSEQRAEIITAVKNEIVGMANNELGDTEEQVAEFAVHHADILLQNIELGEAYKKPGYTGTALRDRYMAENVMWVLSQEEKKGNERIFVSAHIGHIEQNGTYNSEEAKVMGHFLAYELGEAYYAIGCDFYKTEVNIPNNNGKRLNRTFYSYDPLAKAAKKSGFDIAYLDFAQVPQDSPLRASIDNYLYMGSLGESYSAVMEVLPFTYRVWRSPSQTFDSIILISNGHATKIWRK